MKLRRMTQVEVETVLDWAAQEGWNPGLDDAAAFHATDPDGLFVAEIGGAPIAAIAVVNHGPGIAFLGLFICRPDHRGQGVGRALWDHALAHASDRVVGLDGVPDQQPFYARHGFVNVGQTLRFEGRLRGLEETVALRSTHASEHHALITMERLANGYAKPAFMDAWLTETPTRQTLALDRGAGAVGFATIRTCRAGAKIGPLVARTQEDAEALLAGLADRLKGGPVIIDVPDRQTGLTNLCTSLGMACNFTTARMYRGAPPVPGNLVATAATLELG